MGGGKKDDSGKDAARAQEKSNEAAQAEIRRQFNITQANLKPFLDAGTNLIGSQEEGATVEGLDSVLAQIFGSENFQALRNERSRATQGQLAAGGLTRSGTALEEAARVPTELGFQIEQLLSGRGQSIVASGQNAAARTGAFGSNAASGIAGLHQNTGQSNASGILADQQAAAQRGSNLGTLAGAGIGGVFGGFGGAKIGAGIGNAVGSIFFSDPSLKKNVEEVGNLDNLSVYQWDWIDETKGTMIEGCGTIGFMADEVKDKYPHHVYEYGGFMVIDYPSLLDELDESTNSNISKLDIQIQESEHANITKH